MLNNMHWNLAEYRQRVTVKEWREILLAEMDTIVFRGAIVKLVGKRVGPGVYEIYKEKEQSETK